MNKKKPKGTFRGSKKNEEQWYFYEAPHKLASTLQDMLAAWGDRRNCYCARDYQNTRGSHPLPH